MIRKVAALSPKALNSMLEQRHENKDFASVTISNLFAAVSKV